MPNIFNSLCDDFYLGIYINTELELPSDRDTILNFFERIQKQYPTLSNFYQRDNGDCWLEEDRDGGEYRWVTLQSDRLGCGMVNPENLEDSYGLCRLVLELAPYMLSVSHLDIDSLDVCFSMDFNYDGNHDEVIAEALLGSGAFSSLIAIPGAKPIAFSPLLVVALSPDDRLQGRVSVESKTSIGDPGRANENSDEEISVYFTVRQYPGTEGKFDTMKAFEYQSRLAEELMADKIIPYFVRPLNEVIAQRRLR